MMAVRTRTPVGDVFSTMQSNDRVTAPRFSQDDLSPLQRTDAGNLALFALALRFQLVLVCHFTLFFSGPAFPGAVTTFVFVRLFMGSCLRAQATATQRESHVPPRSHAESQEPNPGQCSDQSGGTSGGRNLCADDAHGISADAGNSVVPLDLQNG